MDCSIIRILADENIRTDICNYLKTIQVDVISINECNKKGATDSEVIVMAITEKRILLTCDKHFDRLFGKLQHYGILWLKTNPEYQLEVIQKIIPEIVNKDITGQILKLTREEYIRKSYLPARVIKCTY